MPGVALLLVGCVGARTAPSADDGGAVDADPGGDCPWDAPIEPPCEPLPPGAEPTCAPDDEDPPAIVFGAGADGFRRLACAEPMELVQGPAGGYHILGGLAVAGIGAEPIVVVSYRVTDERCERWSDPLGRLLHPAQWAPLEGEPGWSAHVGDFIFLYASGPEDVVGRPLTINVELQDCSGSRWHDSAVVVPFFEDAAP